MSKFKALLIVLAALAASVLSPVLAGANDSLVQNANKYVYE